MNIRNFAVGDYSAIVNIDSSLNIVWPERPRTPEAWAAADQNRNPKRKFQRLVAVVDGKVYVTTGYFLDGQILCIDLETGSFLYCSTVRNICSTHRKNTTLYTGDTSI